MRLVRGEGGRWQLATAEEVEVGRTVAVDLGKEGVWPAQVEAFVSDLYTSHTLVILSASFPHMSYTSHTDTLQL